MDDFQPIFQGLYDATQALIAANAQMVKLGETLAAATKATQHARDEHLDIRDTLARLESLVLEQGQLIRDQGQEIHALRERLNGGTS